MTHPLGLLRALALAVVLSACGPQAGSQGVPAELRPVDPFELTDHRGQPFGSEDLAGAPYVVSFFFTSCPTICPKIQGAMLDLQTALIASESRCRLVSVSVDPANDTPAVLAKYAADLGADTTRWTLLTGDPEKVLSSIRKSFVTHVGEPETTEEGLVDIGHGGHLILVDGNGTMRGTYEAADPATKARILSDLKALR